MKQKTIKLAFLSTCLLLGGVLFAQRTVNGTVSDESGVPLPGATIVVLETNEGSTTDFDGNYSISVSDGNTIAISFVGYETQNVVVADGAQFSVSLQPDNLLDEVVVTSLGVLRDKRTLSYAVTQIGGEKFQESRTANIGNALTGKIAGVSISSPSTGAGGSTRVTIRGGSSLTGNDQPLYVVNGIPIESGTFGQAGLWGGNDSGDGLASINPDDIESLTVLKGNTASALYGARAANGVILITTKSGKAREGMGISFNSNFTVDTVIDQTDFQREYGHGVDGEKFTNVTDAKDRSFYRWGPKFDGTNTIQFDGVSRPYTDLGYEMTDFYEPTYTWNNSIAFSGGNETGNYRLAISDLRNNDMIPNSKFNRNTVNLSVNSKLEKLTINTSINYTIQEGINRPRVSDLPGNTNFTAMFNPLNVPLEAYMGSTGKLGANEDGVEINHNGNVFITNPYWAAYQWVRKDVTNRVIGALTMKYDITDYLYAQARVGTDVSFRDNAQSEAYGTAFKPQGDYTETFQKVYQNNAEFILGGQTSFDAFEIDYLAGVSGWRSQRETKGAGGNNLVVPFFGSLNNVQAPTKRFGFSETGQNSIFGSVNVGYDDWIYLNLTAREDTFSTLDPTNNKLFYPSVGTSVVISEKVNLPSVISFAKVRASWAEVGGGGPNPYATLQTYSLGNPHNGANTGGFSSNTLANPTLAPYTSSEVEIGANLRFLDNKFEVDLAVYDRKTTNDILNAGISRTSGFNSTAVNVGELTNKGFELLVSGQLISKGDFSWDASFNYAKNTSEAVNLGLTAAGDPIEFLNFGESRVRGGERVRHVLGDQLGVLYGYKHRTSASGEKFYDNNGDPVRSAGVEKLGYTRHPVIGGFSNTFTYKNFSLYVLVDYRDGGVLFAGTNNLAYMMGLHKDTLMGRDGSMSVSGLLFDGGAETSTAINKTIPADRIDNYWTSYGAITENLVHDASYGKLRELSLKYSFPRSMLEGTFIQSANLALVGRNLALLWSNVDNVDPESAFSANAGSTGLEYFTMPQTRNIGLNLNINF